jgi:hypothetical protein
MLSDHIPDTGQHETIFHGEHANRIRTRVPYVRLKRLKWIGFRGWYKS